MYRASSGGAGRPARRSATTPCASSATVAAERLVRERGSGRRVGVVRERREPGAPRGMRARIDGAHPLARGETDGRDVLVARLLDVAHALQSLDIAHPIIAAAPGKSR